MVKPTKPTPPDRALRSNPSTFSSNAEAWITYQWSEFPDYVDSVADFTDERADNALAAALGGDLPPLTGKALQFLRVNASETAAEFAEALVASDLVDLSQVQVEDDTSTVFGQVSGQRLAQAFNASEQQIGIGQTWQNLTGSRSAATSYQNTTGKPITVAVGNTGAGSFGYLDVSTDNVNWINVGNLHPSTGMSAMAIVSNNHYYRLTSWNGTFWAELR